MEAVNKIKFDYGYLSAAMWRDLLIKAKKDFNIQFDLENNDATNDLIRDIVVPQKQWDFTKCKFRCQMCQAGGDWEYPVYYFRCQIISGYAFNLSPYRNSFFIFIPGKETGNYHLVKNKDSWQAPTDDVYKKGIDPEASKTDCWKALNEYLKTLVEMEIEKIKAEKETSSENLNKEPENGS
jgi:hypothetical protein